jgi:cysteine synthase A
MPDIDWTRSRNAASGIFETIGQTPLLELTGVADEYTNTRIFGKLEFVNPSGSIKDRIYREMLTAAEERGDLGPGMEIIECSTGNAGIACTLVGQMLGYDVTVVMPEGMSEERKKLIRAYGGTLVETPGGESDVDLAMDRVDELLADDPDRYWFPNQFANPDNPAAHERTTGPEIEDQLGGAPDAFVAGQGTGGTLTGVGRHLRSVDESAELYAVEPSEAPLLSRQQWGSHGIEGIGDGFLPENLDVTQLNGVVTVDTEDAIDRARSLATTDGVFCGISSGANVHAAIKLATEGDLDTIVTIICDTGQRYFSTPLFDEEADIDIPDRDHPIPESTRETLDREQSEWRIIE